MKLYGLAYESDEPINNQHDYSRICFPGYKCNSDGFVINKKGILNIIFPWYKKVPFGPLSYADYMSCLCHSASLIWLGRIAELRQFDFQMEEVKNGRMRHHNYL